MMTKRDLCNERDKIQKSSVQENTRINNPHTAQSITKPTELKHLAELLTLISTG
jgi:hypothetical protein